MTPIISRRDACIGLSALAGASAFDLNAALAQSKSGIVTWEIDNLKNIGGHAASHLGAPKLVKNAAGGNVEFDGQSGLVLETNPVAGYENFTIEALIRPDGGKETAQRIFHIGEFNAAGEAVSASPPDSTNDSNNRFMFELRTGDGMVWFESFNTGPDYRSLLIDPNKKHPLHTWLVLTQTYDGAMHRSFVNGELQVEMPLKYHVQGPGRCGIGTRLNRVTPFLGGYMRMRFARRALPPEEQMKVPAALKA